MPKAIKKAASKTKDKRQNFSKEQLVQQMKFQDEVRHLKEIVVTLFPKLEGLDTIYDAQTTVNALSGFITAHIEKKVVDIKMRDLEIDLSKEEDSKIKTAILEIIALFPDESAQYLSESLERLGVKLPQFAADKFLKQPMSACTIEDFVSK